MAIRTSIKKIPGDRHLPRHIVGIAWTSAIVAGLFITVVILTFLTANNMMRTEAKSLSSFSSNILPAYQLASFPSLDEQTSLSGWFFPSKGNPISTIILIHDNNLNRLQFDLDSASLYEYLVGQGFNVLAFDLRHSGKSSGQLSTYGYAEWADVLAAVRYAQKYATTHDVVLYGFGSGVSAALMAWQQLPEPDQDLADFPLKIKNLGFDRSYIRALILDTPASTPDDYIRADCREKGLLGRLFLQYTVPYAIRLSAASSRSINLISTLSQVQAPVFLANNNPDTRIGTASIDPLIHERLRLHPDNTLTFSVDEAGSCQAWLQDPAGYIQELSRFFSRFLGAEQN